MKKFIISFFAFAVMSQQLCASCDDFHVDGRVSAFFPTGKLMREIYGNCFANYEIEAGQIFAENYEVWGNVGWVSKNGRTSALHTKTKFEEMNISLGGKYIFYPHECIRWYAGLGVNAAFVYLHNHSSFVKHHVNKKGFGAVVKTGLYFEPVDNLFVELFSDYLYQKIHFHNREQVGGFKVGGGLGIIF